MKDTARRCMTHYVHERLVTQACNTQDGRQQSEDSKEKKEGRREKREKRKEKREDKEREQKRFMHEYFLVAPGDGPGKRFMHES